MGSLIEMKASEVIVALQMTIDAVGDQDVIYDDFYEEYSVDNVVYDSFRKAIVVSEDD